MSRAGSLSRRLRTVAVTLTAVACAFAALGTPTGAAASDQPGGLAPRTGLLFGAFVEQQAEHRDSQAAVTAFEREIGRKLDLHRIYLRWDDSPGSEAILTNLSRGRTPVLSILPQRRDDTRIRWADIAAGHEDAMISRQADAIRALQAPVFLVFHHEPDLGQAHGSPAEYVSAWRHYVEVFRSRGVSNVSWTWTMTPSSFGSAAIGAGADAYYPGDDVVDWLALDAYNWFGCAPGKPAAWRPLAEIVGPFRTWALDHGKPLMLAEWGSSEDPADPGRKERWLHDGLATLQEWTEFRAALYFHAHGTCPWWIDSSADSHAAFTQIAASAAAHGRASASLEVSTGHGAAPLTVEMDASASTGADAPTGHGVTSWSLDFGDGTPPVAGTGEPPAHLRHTYRAGTFRPILRITDNFGSIATDSRLISAAAAPMVTADATDMAATSATLHAWVDPHGLDASAFFEWGTTKNYGNRSGDLSVPAQDWPAYVKLPLKGLAPGSRYHWRVVARSAAGTTVLSGRYLDTTGPPTIANDSVSKSSRSATVRALVHPHSLATTTWFEWGTTRSYGRTTSVRQLPADTWAHHVSASISGLERRRTYYVRAVARNAAGLQYGPGVSFTTR